MERLGDSPHLASGCAAFVWKTLLARKFEQVNHDLQGTLVFILFFKMFDLIQFPPFLSF